MVNIKDLQFLPLSSAQQRMWFMEKILSNHSGYIITVAFELHGDLNFDILNQAYLRLIEKHELLRAGFFEKDAIVSQKIRDFLDFKITEIERDLNFSEESQISKILSDECGTIFCFENPPLLKTKILKINPRKNIIINTLHHIIVDGWSLKIMFQDLSFYYNSLSRGETFIVEKSISSYFNFIHDEIILKNDLFYEESEKKFWKNYLEEIEYIEIYQDKIRVPEQASKGRAKYLLIPNGKTLSLEKIAHANSVSLYVFLLTLFSFIYAKFTGKNYFVIGSPVANRTKEEYEEVFGLFVNTIPIKISFNDEDTFLEILNTTRANVLDAFSHQGYPFEQIVNNVCEQRTMSKNPLFQVMFVLQENIKESFQLTGIEVNEIEPSFSMTRFDLESNFWRTSEGLKWRFLYDESLYDEQTISNFMSFFEKLVDEVISDEKIAFKSFQLLSARERLNLLKLGYGKKSKIDQTKSRTIIDWINDTIVKYPSRHAIEFDEQVISYSELDEYYKAFSLWLEKFKISKSKPVVALILNPSLEMAVAIIGIMASGFTLLPINPDDPISRKEYILKNSGACFILTSSDLKDSLPKIEINMGIFDSINQIKEKFNEKKADLMPLDNSTLAYIIYTSGTTGNPKGVMVSHKNLIHTLVATNESFQFDDSDIFTTFALFSFDIFYFEFFSMLVCGGKTRLSNKNTLFNNEKLVSVLRNTTCFQAVPSLMQQFLNILKANKVNSINGMRRVTTGGEIVYPSLLIKLKEFFPNAEVSVTYGPTEATIVCSKYEALSKNITRCYIGKPLPSTEIRVLDKFLRLVPIGIPGEIHIGGAGVTSGYINEPELTQKNFVIIDENIFYKTGDIGRWDIDGNLEFLGRLDDQIKLRGYRIELDAVSSVIMQHPRVIQACTILNETQEKKKDIVSFVSLDKEFENEISDRILNKNQVLQWKKLFDDVHLDSSSNINDQYDFTGWESIISGEKLSKKHMEEWLSATVLSLMRNVNQERLESKKLKVLEVGCGTGLIIFKLHTYCEHYDAVDFSSSVLHSLQEKIDAMNIKNVYLHQNSADKVETSFLGDYDLIIVNSVIQYFPSIDYLKKIIFSLSRKLRKNGCLFLGDIRDYRKLKTLYYNVIESNPKTSSLDDNEKEKLILKKLNLEQELCVAPNFFSKIIEDKNDFLFYIEPRLESVTNELSAFRYNVIYKKESQSFKKTEVNYKEYKFSEFLSNDIKEVISTLNKSGAIIIRNVIDSRFSHYAKKYASIFEKSQDGPFLSLINKENAVPSQFISRKEFVSYHIGFKYSDRYVDSFDIIITSPDSRGMIKKLIKETNLITDNLSYTTPILQQIKKHCQSEIKEFVKQKLPEYMVPKFINVVYELPLTSHGKINKKKLTGFEYTSSLSTSSLTPETQTQQALFKVIGDVLSIEFINLEDNFFDIGGTSLLAIQVAAELRKFNIKINAQSIFKYQVIADLADYIDSQNQSSKPIKIKTENKNEWKEQIRMLNNKRAALNNHSINIKESTILLLGSTGYLGCHILKELLAQGCCKIYCLVRVFEEDSQKRLEGKYHYYFQSPLPKEVVIISGNISDFHFGLSYSKWVNLSEECDLVINAAANVRHVAHKEEIFLSNYYSVKELIKFASIGKEKFFYHLSTIGIKGLHPDTSLVFTENDFDIGQSHTEDYSLSKFNAEKLVLRYMINGGAASIFRVGAIGPHSEKGYFQENIQDHFITRYLKSTVDCGIAGYWDKRMLALTPVDILAKIIILLITKDTQFNAINHLMTPNETSYLQLVHAMKAKGYPIKIVDKIEFKDIVYAQKEEKINSTNLTGILQILDSDEYEHVKISCEKTNKILADLGFLYPSTEDSWIMQFIEHCKKINYLSSPEKQFNYQVDSFSELIKN